MENDALLSTTATPAKHCGWNRYGIIKVASRRGLAWGASGHCVLTWALLQVRDPQLQLLNAEQDKGNPSQSSWDSVPTCQHSKDSLGQQGQYSLQKAEDKGMKLLSGAVERGQPGHVPAQGVERAGVGACGIHNTDSHCSGCTSSPSPGWKRTPGTLRCQHLQEHVPHPDLSSQRLPPHSRGNSSSGL